MDRIAQRTDVSKRTVYNHFHSKEALFRAIVEDLWTRALDAVDVIFDPAMPAGDQLERIARAEIGFLSRGNLLGRSRTLVATCIQNPDIVGSTVDELCKRDFGIVIWVRDAAHHDALADPEIAGTRFEAMIKAFAY